MVDLHKLSQPLHPAGAYFRPDHDPSLQTDIAWVDDRVRALAYGLLPSDRLLDEHNAENTRDLFDHISDSIGAIGVGGTLQLTRIAIKRTKNSNFAINAACPSTGFETTYSITRQPRTIGAEMRSAGRPRQRISHRQYAVGRILATASDALLFFE